MILSSVSPPVPPAGNENNNRCDTAIVGRVAHATKRDSVDTGTQWLDEGDDSSPYVSGADTSGTYDRGAYKIKEPSVHQTVAPSRSRRQTSRCHHHSHHSRSRSPSNPYYARIKPAIPANIDVFAILENVAKTEGPFQSPDAALKTALSAFTQEGWTTKVEAMLAITRLAKYHPRVLEKELHMVVLALVYEVKNLRTTVSRSAIFTLGDLLVKMRKPIEAVSLILLFVSFDI